MYDTFHHSSRYTTINWISAGMLLISGLCLIATYFLHLSAALVYEGIFILFILALNIALELYDNKLRHNEVPNQVRWVLKQIKEKLDVIHWLPENYPHLYTPTSPCITLQWTYRDNKLVNLPWSLLVKGDIILVRPGQNSPGYCESLEKTNDFPLLHNKEIYGPNLQTANEVFSVPKTRKPLQSRKYRLLETPYLNNLHVALEQALERPVTQHNQQRHLVMIKIIDRFVVPAIFLVICLANVVKYVYLHSLFGIHPIWDLFVLIPVKAVLPLLPLTFPLIWNGLNYYGTARFKTAFNTTRKMHVNQNLFEEIDGASSFDKLPLKYDLKDVWPNLVEVFRGDIMCRSANLMHVLGSVSVSRTV